MTELLLRLAGIREGIKILLQMKNKSIKTYSKNIVKRVSKNEDDNGIVKNKSHIRYQMNHFKEIPSSF